MSIYQAALILLLMLVATLLILIYLWQGHKSHQRDFDDFIRRRDETRDTIDHSSSERPLLPKPSERIQERKILPAPPIDLLPDKDLNTDTSDIKLRSQLYHYVAYVRDVYDGDTIRVDIDLGLGIWRRDQSIRLWKINTPELRGAEREEGLIVRDRLRELILDRQILLRTILDKRGQDRVGKFGRLLGEILLELESGELLNINEHLLDQGMAIPISESGSRLPMPVAMPLPGIDPAEVPHPPVSSFIACRYCGADRFIDFSAHYIFACPNCLDEEYENTH